MHADNSTGDCDARLSKYECRVSPGSRDICFMVINPDPDTANGPKKSNESGKSETEGYLYLFIGDNIENEVMRSQSVRCLSCALSVISIRRLD